MFDTSFSEAVLRPFRCRFLLKAVWGCYQHCSEIPAPASVAGKDIIYDNVLQPQLDKEAHGPLWQATWNAPFKIFTRWTYKCSKPSNRSASPSRTDKAKLCYSPRCHTTLTLEDDQEKVTDMALQVGCALLMQVQQQQTTVKIEWLWFKRGCQISKAR